MRDLALRFVRKALRRVDVLLQGSSGVVATSRLAGDRSKFERYRDLLRGLRLDEGSRGYLETHIERLARTMAFVPPPGRTGSILELGCYMQLTPLLASELGYGDVRGAYLGEAGQSQEKTVVTGDGTEFRCEIDLFDAEADPFPYPDESFDAVLACEIIEHLGRDPMHMLLECRRVLADGGRLLLTTPNCVSLTSVARALGGKASPQVFSRYPDPRKGELCGPHVREYSPEELAGAVRAAGFALERLVTERGDGFTTDTWVVDLLADNGFESELRGEQIYCVAKKVPGAAVERYPAWLYEVGPAEGG